MSRAEKFRARSVDTRGEIFNARRSMVHELVGYQNLATSTHDSSSRRVGHVETSLFFRIKRCIAAVRLSGVFFIMAVAAVCSICMDDDLGIAYECRTLDCDYQMCEPCLKDLLGDSTAANSRNCPMCKENTGVRMVEAIAGKGAVRLVQDELRASVEYDVNKDYIRKKEGKEELDSLSIQARKIFNDLSEKLTMKCPRCSTAFYDYDGCNALRCGQIACHAAFCALCLKDCGSDAHEHVRQAHGNLFDKTSFERSRLGREKAVIQICLDNLNGERFELKQMVQNLIDRAKLGEPANSPIKAHLLTTFIAESRKALKNACSMDRLSILRDTENREWFRQGLTRNDISPRLVIPDEYRVRLIESGGSVYTIRVSEETEHGGWKNLHLENLSQLSPSVDILANLKQAVQCGVIAFSRARKLYQSQVVRAPKGADLSEDDVSIAFYEVNPDGEVSDHESVVTNLEIVGLNQNLRMIKLLKYVDESDAETLSFDPLKHLVGVCSRKPVLEELKNPPPRTLDQLNPEQRSVAHPLCTKTAMEVAGPPGSGKTKTITELVRGLLECTSKNIVVMSERNGAIDAIAEKFADECLDIDGNDIYITDLDLWNKIMTFGASTTVGPSTELFTLEAKLRYHPELLLLKKQLKESKHEQNALTRKMRDAIGVALSESMKAFRGPTASTISDRLKQDLKQPLLSIAYVVGAGGDIKDLLQRTSALQREDVATLVERNSVLLGPLSLLHRSQREQMKTAWDRNEVVSKLRGILVKLLELLSTPTFSEDNAQKMQSKIREIEETLRRAEQRLTDELPRMACLQMSTIGSSHKLLASNVKQADSDDEIDALVAFESLTLDSANEKKTIVIFDEAGCIPGYELLGLTRLETEIEALVLVGDKEQLPPYQPSASFSSSPHVQSRRYSNRGRGFAPPKQPQVKSLLDYSRLSLDSGEKVKLTTQYRVPRDIAAILNDRVYNGDYKTAPTCKAPAQGLRFVHVRQDAEPRRKYVNRYEVDEVLDIIARHQEEQVMVITPYKNQQREIQFQLKRMGIDSHKVLTIDQCQGQEADTVILSLVQKPTRFLNKNRLNVALSRVRQNLYFLTDKREFRKAAMDANWDCRLMANDILQLWDEYM